MGARGLIIALLFSVSCASGTAQDRVPQKLVELLDRPDQTEIAYKVDVEKPILVFQQQYLFRIRAFFTPKIIEHRELRHLETLVRLQDADGLWLAGQNYDDFPIPEGVRGKGLNYSTSILLRPGKYRVAIAMFDAETQKANVLHHDVVIPTLNKDPFPQIDDALPPIEFPRRVNGHRGFWMLGDKMQPLRLPKGKYSRIDVVLDITKRFHWDLLYRLDVQVMLEAGNVLSHFQPQDGCVRLSVIDALRMKVLLDRFPADEVNWSRLQEAIENINQDVIDVHVLSNQRKIAEFTHDFLQRLTADPQACGSNQASTHPLVIVVSPDVILPDGNRIGNLDPLEKERFLYIHVGTGSGWSDGMGQILSSARPERMNCESARDFRGALGKIASQISSPQ